MNQGTRPRAMQLSACIALVLAAASVQARPLAQAQDPEGEPWQDNVIAPEDLPKLPEDTEPEFDPSGLPRSLGVEFIASLTERGDRDFNEFGLRFSGFRETESLGTWSLDATALRSDDRDGGGGGDFGGTATMWQRGLAMDGDWLGNNGLGVLNTPAVPLLRDQFRFFLPSVPMAGLSTEWRKGRGDVHWVASAGRAGVFDGARVVGFDLADGSVASLGTQWKLGSGWEASFSALSTDGRIVPDDQGGSLFQEGDSQGVHLALGRNGGKNGLVLNLQGSDGEAGGAWGAWLDARHERGPLSHRYGLFRLGPDLGWGGQPINNDSQGAYYRVNYGSARWTLSGGLDRIASVSGDSFDGWYATSYARYQPGPSLGYGGNLSLRRSDAGQTVSGLWFVDKRNRWGQTRLQFEHVGGDNSLDSWRAGIDHQLTLRQGRRLSLSTNYGEVAYDNSPAQGTFEIAAYGGLDLGSRVTLDGSLRWSRGDDFRGTDLNLNLAWRVSSRWWLVGTVYENQGSRRSPFIIDPLATEQPFVNLPRDRSVFLSLRYQRQAGTSASVLGGGPGTAAGSIRGSVFLDENGDGVRAASELPAANVTVLLDGRYAVRTDSQGEFEFPRVAVGAHTIEVVPDNLPLPWFIDEQADRRAVEVQVRDTARVEIGARRQR